MEMMVITTINSMMVKPRRRSFALPVRICAAISCLLRCFRKYIEYVLSTAALRLRVVLHASFSPVRGTRERIFGDPPQELHLLVHLARFLYAFHQHFQRFRITFRTDFRGRK